MAHPQLITNCCECTLFQSRQSHRQLLCRCIDANWWIVSSLAYACIKLVDLYTSAKGIKEWLQLFDVVTLWKVIQWSCYQVTCYILTDFTLHISCHAVLTTFCCLHTDLHCRCPVGLHWWMHNAATFVNSLYCSFHMCVNLRPMSCHVMSVG